MPYNNAIPQTTDIPAQSQAQLLANFQEIATMLNVDHVEFNIADQGKHFQATFPEQVVVPTPGANELALYSKQSTTTAVSELYCRRESSGTELEMTASILSTNPAIGSMTSGWTMLPSGILMKWGEHTDLVATGLRQFTFPVAADIPVFGAVFQVLVTAAINNVNDDNFAIRLVTFNTTSYTVYSSQRTVYPSAAHPSQTYLAIGRL